MARFQAGLYRNAAGQSWMIWAKDENNQTDKNHPLAQQIWFDGNLSWEQLLYQIQREFRVDSIDIERYGN